MTSDADWERLLSSAASVARIVPDSIFGDASRPDAEEVRHRFASALVDLECVSSWVPMPIGRMPIADGRFDGIETTIRDQTRFGPLETTTEVNPWVGVVVPTFAEMLRIKLWLVLSRNASRDYADTAALARKLGLYGSLSALSTLDDLYPQSNGASALQQAVRQLAQPLPFDRNDRTNPSCLAPTPIGWTDVKRRCLALATDVVLTVVRSASDA